MDYVEGLPPKYPFERDQRLLSALLRRSGSISQLKAVIFVSYCPRPHLEIAGFLVTQQGSANNLVAFCPMPDGSVAQPGDILKQLKIAQRIAKDPEVQPPPIDAIDLRVDGENVRPIPQWIFGLVCVPLGINWDGQFMHPQPFCPKLFSAMASQPIAANWIMRQPISQIGS